MVQKDDFQLISPCRENETGENDVQEVGENNNHNMEAVNGDCVVERASEGALVSGVESVLIDKTHGFVSFKQNQVQFQSMSQNDLTSNNVRQGLSETK